MEVCGSDLFDEAPFRAAWMFAESDRAWLEGVRATYRADLEAVMAARGSDQDDEAARRPIEEQVQEPYRTLLREIAKTRLSASPEIQRWLFDGRRLADLPQPSEQHGWLTNVLRRMSPHSLFAVGLNKPEDIVYFAATDLPEIVRLDLEVREALLPYRDSTVNAEENERILRPFAERFQVLVSSRRP